MQPSITQERRWFWATLGLSSVSIVALVFAAWEVVENRLFSHVDYLTLHYLYITRGIGSSLLLAFWAAWYVLRQRRLSEEELRRSHERYRRLLEASPGAVVLYDATLRVSEWNATAERVYGFSKAEALGGRLPTVPPEKDVELEALLARVAAGETVLDVETLRLDRLGNLFDVQLSLLPFREPSGENFFLEVTGDIRERVRLRQSLLELEKLASMGQMAAGTAHHLNTPLAAMLLRVQMMRERAGHGPLDADLEKLETGIHFCRQFVQRLLDFSRRAPMEKRPQDLCGTIESIVGFLQPAMVNKSARVTVECGGVKGLQVFGDRNLLEVLFSTLLSNAADALSEDGAITVRCQQRSAGAVEIRVADNGCGIAAGDLAHVFDPFFTTKPPGKGTGLGLAIAQNIVREHGGSIRLESEPGRGTEAVVELPLWQAARAGAR